MSRVIFVAIFVMVLFRWARSWRRVVGVTLIATLMAGMVFPPPVYAQFGIIGAIQNILNIINGAIRNALNTIGAVSQSLQALHQQIIWPVQLVNRARSSIASLIAQFRGVMQSIYVAPVSSATLPTAAGLEGIIRNRQTTDFPALTQSYYQAFGALPAADQADPLARNMIDIDDGLTLATLKTLKATDQAGDLILASGNQIEDDARSAAPGSAPFLSASAMAANIQSQAMMQKMLAAMLRQEAARIAHENAVRKRDVILAVKATQTMSDFLKRR
ncbi:MAG TPA: hypothetical protein VER98_17735 [Terriglobia bacterium]|nr:hypothetical protein [Terriglobia bacterium]